MDSSCYNGVMKLKATDSKKRSRKKRESASLITLDLGKTFTEFLEDKPKKSKKKQIHVPIPILRA